MIVFHERITLDKKVSGRNGGGVLIYIAEYLVSQNKLIYNLTDMNVYIWVYVKIYNKCLKEQRLILRSYIKWNIDCHSTLPRIADHDGVFVSQLAFSPKIHP